MKLYNITTQEGTLILANVKLAVSFWDRLIGLMFKKKMKGYEGLIIENCNSVHTSFMAFDLDVFFFDKDWTLLRSIEGLKPWRITPFVFGAKRCLEVESGKQLKFKMGEKVELKCLN